MDNFYQVRKDRGLCVQYGRELPSGYGYVMCVECRQTRKSPVNLKESKKKTALERPRTVDEMAIEAKRRGISYGRLQQEETIVRLKERERANLTLQRWGR